MLAFATYGVAPDIDAYTVVADALAASGFGPYDTGRWPYPGGFLPVVAALDWVSETSGLPMHGVVQLPMIAADAGIAYLVWTTLRGARHAAPERVALAGAALVALGPSFWMISGYHGQLDAVAVLPAFAGVLLWDRGGTGRGWKAGLLVGLGAAMKQPLGFAVLALWPTARSWRERVVLVGTAVAVPLLSLAPFAAQNPRGVFEALTEYRGVPGFGGISAFVQPELTRFWAVPDRGVVQPSSATLDLIDAQNAIVLVAVLAAGALLWHRRVPPLPSACLVWLVVFVANANFAFQYLVWGLPFFLAAGHVRKVLWFELAALPAMVLLYWRPEVDGSGWLYWVAVQAVWLALVAAMVIQARQVWRWT